MPRLTYRWASVSYGPTTRAVVGIVAGRATGRLCFSAARLIRICDSDDGHIRHAFEHTLDAVPVITRAGVADDGGFESSEHRLLAVNDWQRLIPQQATPKELANMRSIAVDERVLACEASSGSGQAGHCDYDQD